MVVFNALIIDKIDNLGGQFLAILTLLFKDEQFGHEQLSQFSKTDALHLRQTEVAR